MTRRSTLVLVTVAGLFVATSCSSDDSSDGVPATDAAADSTPTPTPTAVTDTVSATVAGTAPNDSTVATDTQPAGDTIPETTEPIELTDSYQGVTADTIRIGAAYIDVQQLNDVAGFDFDVVPLAEAYGAWTAAQNERGGINGRQLETVAKSFQLIGATDSERVCTELIEDDQVFAVIGQFTQDRMLCVTQTYGHPYVGLSGETPALQEASGGRFFAAEMSPYDQRVNGVGEMIANGDLDGKRVGVVWVNPVENPTADVVRSMLEDAGIEVVEALEVGSMSADAVANDAAWSAALERFEVAGVEVLVSLADLGAMVAVAANGFEATIGLTTDQIVDGRRYLDQVAVPDESFANTIAVSISSPDVDRLLADPGVQQCLDEYGATSPAKPIDVTDIGQVQAIVDHCRAFRLMVEILTAGGGDLNPETFVAAGEGIGDITLPALPGYLGPDKRSVGSELSRYEWDPVTRTFLPVGEPISIL